MLSKLAVKNIKKSIKDYGIYFFTLVVGVVIFYIFNSLEAQQSMLVISKSKYDIIKSLVMILEYVSVFVSIILGFLIVYSNNFLVKRRKKELGLYLTLGMSKRKVSTILVIETLLVGLLSLGIGLLLGVFLSQFLSIFTAKLFEADMTSFSFIFSSKALIKTILYFGFIFILVMIFNVISLSRYKLVDLLNANKKNEKVKFRNKYIIFVTFILSIVLLSYAYYKLLHGGLISFDKNIIYMLVSGAMGTFLFFFSVSGFILKIFEKIKKLYYKELNIFTFKQISSKVNTTVFSTTIICLMLLFTIGILSGSLSLINVYNSSLSGSNVTDFTIISFENDCVVKDPDEGCTMQKNDTNLPLIADEQFFKNNVTEYVYYNMYLSDTVTINDLIDSKTKKQLQQQYGDGLTLTSSIDIMKESDYNSIMHLYNEKPINLNPNEYLLTSNSDTITEYFNTLYRKGNIISINKYNLKPASKEIISVSFQNYTGSSNMGTIIINDDVAKKLDSKSNYIIGNYVKTNDIETFDENFIDSVFKFSNNLDTRTKYKMETTSVGLKAIVIFVGLYLGIIFAISSATVLAIGQLSEASDNKERYRVLKQIGSDEKMIKKALFTQIFVAFIIPLVVALVHAFFGLRELNGIIKLIGEVDLTSNIFLTTLFIIIVYGGYFIATYLISKNIIKDKN